MNNIYHIRPYKQGDHAFIMSTFLRGLYYGDSWFSLMPKDDFMSNYKTIAEAVIKNASVAVACLNEDPDVILGYSILSKDGRVLHYIFVKTVFRKQGISKNLVPPGVKAVTHLTTLGKSLLHKIPGAVFNPFKVV